MRPRKLRLPRFWLDEAEIGVAEVARCQRAGKCEAFALPKDPLLPAPLTPARLSQVCRFRGGRLPTEAQWIYGAMTAKGHRYPWGQAGAICRRASFGLVAGPCAWGGGPDSIGSRSAGKHPLGLVDLAGNLAEWTRAGPSSGGHKENYVAHGGSFVSQRASELRAWQISPPEPQAVGGRCAYERLPVRL